MRSAGGFNDNADDDGSQFSLPFIGHMSLPRQLRLLMVLFALGISVMVLGMWQGARVNAKVAAQIQVVGDIMMHSQRACGAFSSGRTTQR